MVLLKCLLKPARETFPYKLVTYRIHWSHTRLHRLRQDLCSCHLHMVPIYHKYFVYRILPQYTSIYNGRKKGEHCAKTHRNSLCKIFHRAPITQKIQVICITIYYITLNNQNTFRVETDTMVVSSKSLTESTFSHPCAFLSQKNITQIHSVAHQKASRSHLKTFGQKRQSREQTRHRNLHRSLGSIGHILQTSIMYRSFICRVMDCSVVNSHSLADKVTINKDD